MTVAADEGSPTLGLTERVRTVLALEPDAPALEFEDRWRTWGELAATSDRLAMTLESAGVGAAAAVGVVMRNCPAVVAAWISVVSSRQCLVVLSHMSPAAQLGDEIGRLGLAAVVADARDWEIPGLHEAVRRSGALGVAVQDLDAVEVSEPSGVAREELGSRTMPGIAVQMLSSGTTGTPKRIPLPYASLARALEQATHYESPRDPGIRLRGGVAVIAWPLAHIGGLWFLVLNLLNGRRVALLERFAVEPWVRLIRKHRPRNAPLPPAALQMILDAAVPPEALSSLHTVTSGSAPVRPELVERFESTYGAHVLVAYGATEFAGGVAGWTLGDRQHWGSRKRGSVGRAHPGVHLRIVDETTGAPLRTGSVGLLEVRSPQLAIDGDGWVRSTDYASLDDDGFLWIHGRADAVIIRGGFKVDPGAVTDVLVQHPAIADAVVVGVPDARLGEVPVAAVELTDDAGTLDAGQLIAWARDRLAPYQVPVRVVALRRLPRTPSLKVRLHDVRELLLNGSDAHCDLSSRATPPAP